MENVVIKLKRIEVLKPDMRNSTLKLGLKYEENGQPKQISKTYDMKENVENFAHKLISEIRNSCRKDNTMPIDDLDFLNHYTNIIIDRKGETSAIEKISNAIKRFKDKVRSLKTLDRHESYIQKYNEFIGLKANLE